MSTKSILNRSISPSKVEVEIQDSKDLTDEQKSLYKAQSIVERCRRLATSPVKLLPKDIENLATLLRQLKLYLTVNEDLRDPFARSPSFTVLISVAKRFFSWMGILSDFISCVGLALSKRPVRCGDPEGSTQGSDSGADRYNELLELMCGYGFIDICTIFLKKQETCAESTRLCCLETILMLCDYVSLRSSKTTAPPGRDVVFDGKAMIKSAVHLLVKNGAIKLFPKLLLDNYGSFGGNGSSCIVQLMLFILRNCSSENATEMCRAIDKGFVSAAVVLLFRSQPTPGEAPSPALMHVIILVAG